MNTLPPSSPAGAAQTNRDDIPALLAALYRQHAAAGDPYVSPVLRLSTDIGRMLRAGTVTMDDLGRTVARLTHDALESRGRRLGHYLGACARADNLDALRDMFRRLARDGNAAVAFDEFRRRTAHVFYGFVFTAHPTFMMTPELTAALAAYAAARSGGDDRDSAAVLAQAEALPFTPPGIHEEAALSLEAIDNLHEAFAALYEALFDVAADLYPADWTALRPRLGSIATWVGFDLDGRRDIRWATTLEKRMALQVRQLRFYESRIDTLARAYPEDMKALAGMAGRIRDTMEAMDGHARFFRDYDQGQDDGLRALQDGAKALIRSAGDRLLDARPLQDAAETCLAAASDPALRRELMVLLAQMQNFGLSRADVHFRINANQIHNAIGNHIRLSTHPDHPSQRRSYIDEITALLDGAEEASIDFGDIAEEEMTARYEFMLIRQIVKYVDRGSPVRFLIAETESAFTLLAALYYARRFGVEAHVDLCPLFETGRALQDSSRYMEVLLENPHFRAYIEKRGRLCIQTGYSDAGRYIGQPAAGASIERLKERFSSLLAEHKMKNVTLLFFDTHGESIGRGGHPESLEQRIRYVASPYVLHGMKATGTPYTQESSYQGGDGFLPFLHPDTTLAVMTRVMGYMLRGHEESAGDPYYDEPSRGEVTKFFTAATAFQTALIGNPSYAALLGAFGLNMMYRSGSRAVKRPRETEKGPERLAVGQIRAIPHNAILGQFGILANTISGLGRACREHMDLAAGLADRSPRFRAIMAMADRALSLSDPQVVKAYIGILDPTFWIAQARETEDVAQSNKFAAIATILEHHDFHDGMLEIYRRLDWDHTLLRRFRQPAADEAMEKILCLHAIRIALLRDAFIIAGGIPRFSPHHQVTREQLIRIVFHMDIERAAEHLAEIFPARAARRQDYDFGEDSAYRAQEKPEGYAAIRTHIVAPLQDIQDMTRRISAAIAHYIGFFG